MSRVLLGLDAAGAIVAAAYGAVGLRSALRSDPGGQESFWAAQSAVRTWSVAVPLLVSLGRSRPSPDLLVAAALVQAGDAAVGVWRRNRSMALAPALMSLVHLVSARRIRSATPLPAATTRCSS